MDFNNQLHFFEESSIFSIFRLILYCCMNATLRVYDRFFYFLLEFWIFLFQDVMSRDLRPLTTQELERILEEWEDSEDGLDLSDNDDVADPSYKIEPNEHESSDEGPDVDDEVQAAATTLETTCHPPSQDSTTATDPRPAIDSPSTSSTAPAPAPARGIL